MSYVNTLNPTQKKNAQVLQQQMVAKGITNPFTQAAILAVISKESSFIPQNENLSYSAQRITQVWPMITPAIAATLANNPQKLGDYVYGPTMNASLGNKAGEGYKYRGRGYNQITGRANYDKIGKQIGVDLINNPDALNDPKVAADAAILFFTNGITAMAKLGKLSQYNATNINDFKNQTDSLGAIYNVNAGIGSSKAKLDADTTGGKAKATSRVNDLLTFLGKGAVATTQAVSATTKSAEEVVKKNPWTVAIVAGIITIATVLIIKAIKTKK